ncbi:flagellar protein FlgN [Cytobacillus sp. NCCP-133]|uniref:flagellar protein FlgN n=1 Tax=Cytobacillus sp. NCCP-133 TaxID=766848 RepID=UPI00222E75F3|nr:flagellar protein FlgN [Cytobacillus sp. NCCP-133]GLB60194.1 hypothetical protein NCCP133_23260 [Cytobacillus sp. NCCP-133]
MSAEKMIKTLQNLLLLYKSLNQIALKKTEVIKKGNADSLNVLINEEQKHITGITKWEKLLMDDAKQFLLKKGMTVETPSLSDSIMHSSIEEKQTLIDLKNDLTGQVNLLKQQNNLNQQLLEQSLQFVNMSLDMLLPAIDSFNYEPPNHLQDLSEDKRSIFDSKA